MNRPPATPDRDAAVARALGVTPEEWAAARAARTTVRARPTPSTALLYTDPTPQTAAPRGTERPS